MDCYNEDSLLVPIFEKLVSGEILFPDTAAMRNCSYLLSQYCQKVKGGTLSVFLLILGGELFGNNMGKACTHYRCKFFDCGGILEFSQLKVRVHADYIQTVDVIFYFFHYL